MRLMVIGANGLLGSNVVTAARDLGWDVVGTYHSTAPSFDIRLDQVDITDGEYVGDVISDTDPDWIVNCAAMTDVDGCEERPGRASAVNAEAPGEIATVCASNGVRLLHVSTDYVFDGASSERYGEDASVSPVQVYGETKLSGEQAVREAGDNVVIARLSFVYGIHRSTDALTGFPEWVRDRLKDGEETPLFTDQHVTPSRAGAAAETLCDLVNRDVRGTTMSQRGRA